MKVKNDAMLYQLSYEATHWERGQFIEFILTGTSQTRAVARRNAAILFVYLFTSSFLLFPLKKVN